MIEINTINLRDFIEWLTTQKNANGTLFLRKVANQYAKALTSVPPKLELPLTADERSVCNYTTAFDFDRLCDVFRNAKNFKEVNRNTDHGAFSAGMRAYRRYLDYLYISKPTSGSKTTCIIELEKSNLNKMKIGSLKSKIMAYMQ